MQGGTAPCTPPTVFSEGRGPEAPRTKTVSKAGPMPANAPFSKFSQFRFYFYIYIHIHTYTYICIH